MYEIAYFHIKRACRYKVELFIEIINVVLNFCVQYYLWSTVLKENNLFFDTENEMIIYYFMVSVLSVLLRCNASDIADAFKNGRMDREIIRPINVFILKMAENIFSNLFLFICSFPVLFGLAFVCFHARMGLDIINLTIFSFSIIWSYIIYYCTYFLVGLMALVIDEVWAIRGIVGFCINMVAGYYLPLDMFPDIISNILEYTPFYYMYYFPALLINNFEMLSYEEVIIRCLIMIIWAFILWGISQYAYKKLIKNYAAFGG